jgi:RNA polymerase sigma-70 factor (ECF subfamily)
LRINNTQPEYFKPHPDTDGQDLDDIYLDYFSALYKYAYAILNDKIIAEEMIHQVFLKILEKGKAVDIHTSLKAYLYRSVHNECLNYLKHQQIKNEHQSKMINVMSHESDNPSGKLQYRELEQRLREAINQLPEQCRTIFQLSRFEELKYAEIAAQLGISIKTVEGQMSKALKKLRIQLADYLPLILWLLINLK